MKNTFVGEMYYNLKERLRKIDQQLDQPNGYPFNPFRLRLGLQNLIEGEFGLGEVYRVELGGPTTTDQIVRELRKNEGFSAHACITQANFPLRPRKIERIDIEFINPGCSFNEEEGLKFLEAADLGRPTYEHAIRFAEQYARTTTGKRPYVIFLHEHLQDPHLGHRIVCVNRDHFNYGLFLGDFDRIKFEGNRCVLAGVRP